MKKGTKKKKVAVATKTSSIKRYLLKFENYPMEVHVYASNIVKALDIARTAIKSNLLSIEVHPNQGPLPFDYFDKRPSGRPPQSNL